MKRTYDFATVGFRPHTETEEFVTIGALALDTQARQFDFTLLDPRKTVRIATMFPEAKSLYKEVRSRLESEFKAIRQAVNGNGVGADVPLFPQLIEEERGLFAAITHPREGVVCYPVKGRRIATDMDEMLNALRRRFIERHLLAPAHAVEEAMARGIADVLREARLLPAYTRDARLGPEEYMVPFAFAHMTGEHRADRALRALNFDLATPTEIYNHGGEWITRINRLEKKGYRPERCLFAMRPPSDNEGLRMKAFEEIRLEFLAQAFVAPIESDAPQIIEFARLEVDLNLQLAG